MDDDDDDGGGDDGSVLCRRATWATGRARVDRPTDRPAVKGVVNHRPATQPPLKNVTISIHQTPPVDFIRQR